MSFVVNIKRSNKGAVTVTPAYGPVGKGAPQLSARMATNLLPAMRLTRLEGGAGLVAPSSQAPPPERLGVRALVTLPRFYRIEQEEGDGSGGGGRPTARLYPPLPGSKRAPNF